MEWVAPKSVYEVRYFMGLAGYYRKFIRDFSHFYYPITSLQWKGNKFEWSDECAACFKQLKQLLTNDAMLKISYPEKEFVVCTDGWKRGLGGVLMYEVLALGIHLG